MNSVPSGNAGEASGVVNTLSYMAELSGIVIYSLFFFGAGRFKMSLNFELLQHEHISYDVIDNMLLGKG